MSTSDNNRPARELELDAPKPIVGSRLTLTNILARVRRRLGTVFLVGGSGALAMAPNAVVDTADKIALGMLLLIAAVLFSSSEAPAERLVRILKALRRTRG